MAPIEINSVLLPGHQPSPLQHPPLPLPPPLIPLTSTATPPTSPPSPLPPHHPHPSHLTTLTSPTTTLTHLDMIKSINDPEHPWTLEELNVLQQAHIEVDDTRGTVSVFFTPTIPHCSMATLIGLSIRVKLLRVLPERFKVKGRVCVLELK